MVYDDRESGFEPFISAASVRASWTTTAEAVVDVPPLEACGVRARQAENFNAANGVTASRGHVLRSTMT